MKYLIVGLGNVGAEYVGTRHNVGFMVLNQLIKDSEVTPEISRLARTAVVKYKGRHLHLVWPTTYMNLSGKAVRYYLQQHKIPIGRLLVVTDDLALPLGRGKLKGKGSDGGHNGLKHINLMLNTQSYARMRVGIGNDFPKGHQSDYVLSPFLKEEEEALEKILDKSVKAIKSFVTVGLGRTMESYNRKK